jgi:ornithine carbamoyltransferase
MVGCAKMGLHFARRPKALWPKNPWSPRPKVAQETKATIELIEDIDFGVKNTDVIYTDVWVSMGEPKETGPSASRY